MSRKKKVKFRKSGPKAPPTPSTGWELYTKWERCPDCDLREALDITGRPNRDYDPHHKQLRRKGAVVNTTPRVVDDCENCKGTGRVLRERSGDPMKGGWLA